MEPTLEGALQKIFGEDFGAPKGQETSVSRAEPQPAGKVSEGGKRVVLSQSDYLEIKKYFEHVLKTQNQLDQSLVNYRKDLEALGNALDSATVIDEAKEAVPATPAD
jgi:hypothetical protein